MSIQGWLTLLSLLSIGGVGISMLALPRIIEGLPPRYFIDPPQRGAWTVRRVARHLVGAFLVVAGGMMLLLPGQGVLTILAGLLFLDVPGKHALLARLAARPTVRRTLQRLRARRGVPHLTFDPDS